MTSRRVTRTVLLALAVLVVVILLVVGVSATVDRPQTVAGAVIAIDAPQSAVWAVLADLESYEAWNPVIQSVDGTLREGETLRLRLARSGQPAEDLAFEVVIVNEERKLRWMRRTFAPGIRDEELEIRLEPNEGGGTLVRGIDRYEGVLAPLVDAAPRRDDIAVILEALRERAEASS
jgi:hypothetical protein